MLIPNVWSWSISGTKWDRAGLRETKVRTPRAPRDLQKGVDTGNLHCWVVTVAAILVVFVIVVDAAAGVG